MTSSFTLPIMALITLVVWMLPDLTDGMLWLSVGVTFVAAYLIMELNNRNALLRVRSRMMSATFLALMIACPMLHGWHVGQLCVLCLLLTYFTLFASYQLTRPEGYVFHAFLFIALGSMFFPPMLVLVPVSYVSMMFQLRNFTWRSMVAGLLGALVPYWIYAAYAIWNNQLDTAFDYLSEWFSPQWLQFQVWNAHQWVSVSIVFFFSLLSFVHLFRTAYNDKIRTRMLSYVIATFEVVIAAGLIVLPQYFEEWMRLFIANSSLLIAHYYALAKGRFFDTWFYLTMWIVVGLAVFNYFF